MSGTSGWYGLIAVSAMLYAIVALLVQLAAADVPTMEVTLIRGAVQGCFCACFMMQNGISFLPSLASDRLLVYGRAIIGSLGFILYFHAIAVLPLGDALTVASMYPVTAAIATRIILKEKVHWTAAVAMCAAIGGVVMVCQPHFIFSAGHGGEGASSLSNTTNTRGHSNANAADTSHRVTIKAAIHSRTAGYVSGLLASGLIGLSYVFFRSAKNVHSLQFMALYSASTCVISIALSAALPGQELHIPHTWPIYFYLLGQGLLASVAQFLFIFASKRLPSARASCLQISDIFWGYVLQITVFKLIPNLVSIVGALTVLAGSIGVVLAKDVYEDEMSRQSKLPLAAAAVDTAAQELETSDGIRAQALSIVEPLPKTQCATAASL